MQIVKEINPQYVTNQSGKKTAVLLPIAEFEQIMEDLDDLAKIAERRDEQTISQTDLIAELKSDGLI
jgi:PHD/YefM family antitoxin component YafN of YafNO toxin-antitoxin module